MPAVPRRHGPVGGHHVHDAAGHRGDGPAHQAGAVRLPLDREQARSALGGQGAEQGRLAARSGAQVQPAARRVRPPSAPAQGERDQLRPLVLHARPRPRRPRRSRPGRRRPAGPPTGEAGVGSAPSSASSSSRCAQPGPGDQGDARAAVVRGQQVVELVGPVPQAPRRARRPPSAGATARRRRSRPGRSTGSGATARTQVGRSWADTRRSTALTRPAGRGPTAGRVRSTDVDTAAWVEHPHAEQLVGAEPQHGRARRGCEAGRRPVETGGEHGVVRPLPAQRARRPARSRRRRRGRSSPWARSRAGQQEVGVGVLGRDRAQHLEGRRAAGRRQRCAGVAAGRRDARAAASVGRPSGSRTGRSSGTRAPRAQSAAGICLRPCALTSPSRTGADAGADVHAVLAHRERAGGERRSRRGRRRPGPSFTRSPSNDVQAPGRGRAGSHRAVDGVAPGRPSGPRPPRR